MAKLNPLLDGLANDSYDQVDAIAEFYDQRGIKYNIGYVYIIKAENGLYKIGKSITPTSRISTLRTASPVDVQMYRIFKSSDYHYAEEVLHDQFSEKRERGEWFRLSEEDLKYLDAYVGNDHFFWLCNSA